MKINKKLLAAAGAVLGVAASAAAGAYVTTKLMVQTALDREQPKITRRANKRIAGHQKNEEFETAQMDAAEALREQDHENVEITSDDGIRLVGHFYPCENAKRVIIAFHGWRSSWDRDFGMIAEFWHQHGCSVLYAEQRGQNASGGKYMGFGLKERFDCVNWANWVNCRCGKNLPVYLAGVSMGATTVLMASDLQFPENVRGIIADCGFTSPKEIWRHVAKKNLHMPYGVGETIADAICKKKLDIPSDDHSTIEALEKTRLPVLFIHGTDDHFVPVDMTYENYEACASQKWLVIVPGADHAMSYYVNPREYQNAVLSFWQNYDQEHTV